MKYGKVFVSAMLAALFLCAPAVCQAETSPGTPILCQGCPDPRQVFSWNRAERLLGFKSVEKITPVHTVAAGGPLRELPLADDSPSMKKLRDGLEKSSAEFMRTGDIVGIIVITDGQILLEKYAHGFRPEDRWTSFSVAKSITGALAGAALHDGSLESIDDPVVKYVPELKGSAYDGGVTVRHLLTMTSGVEWNEGYLDPASDVAALAMGAGDAEHDPLLDLAQLPRAAPPGLEFSYKTGETNLLGLVIMRATGQTLAEYFSEKIWQPFGMEQDAYWALDGQGRELAACCLSMTLRDYARFGLFMLEGGRANGRQVLGPAWLKEAVSDQSGYGYGYQWHMLTEDDYAALGIYGQMIAVDTMTNSVAVILSAWDEPLSDEGTEARYEYLSNLKAQLMLHKMAGSEEN